jgi:hypothetical protein
MTGPEKSTSPVGRSESRAVACPYCHAKPGERCKGTRGPREASHMERVRAALGARDDAET